MLTRLSESLELISPLITLLGTPTPRRRRAVGPR